MAGQTVKMAPRMTPEMFNTFNAFDAFVIVAAPSVLPGSGPCRVIVSPFLFK
jgi:hypothetical protein